MQGYRTEQPDAQAPEQLELATARRAWRGRVLAWLALAVWVAGLLAAYQAQWRREAGQALAPGDVQTGLGMANVMVGYGSLALGGLLGAALAGIGVRQARRDRLAWLALALNVVTVLVALAILLRSGLGVTYQAGL